MNVVFVNPTDNIWGQGVNILASILRDRKHTVRTVYLPSLKNNVIKFDKDDWLSNFGDADIYLVSFMSNSLPRAIEFTRFIKGAVPGIPVVWGGVHPTAMPEDSLSYVDYVGRAECEEALPEFLERFEKGLDMTDVRNFWVRGKNGAIFRNPTRPPVDNLDSLPVNDYGIDNKYLVHMGKIAPMTVELLTHYIVDYPIGRPLFYTMTSRGCPFFCSYCYNAKLNKEHGYGKIRKRSLKKVISEEVKPALEKFPFFRNMVLMSDDDFLNRGIKDLRDFCTLWKKDVKVPFACLATPSSISREKMDALMDAGLRILEIGVQTGSERINESIYDRHSANKAVLDKMRVLKEYVNKKKLLVICDFIIDNPYEKDDDIKKSISLYLDIPFRSEVNFFALTPYPGTPIHERMKNDGLIKDDYEEFAREFSLSTKKSYRYLTLLFIMKGKFARWIPGTIVRLLSSWPMIFLGNAATRFFFTPMLRSRVMRRIGRNMAERGALLYGHVLDKETA